MERKGKETTMSSRSLFRAGRRTWQWFLLILVAAIGIGSLATPAEASHFRYGHTSWRQTGITNQIDFTVQNAFRRDANPCVNVTTNTTTACTAPDTFPAVGDVIVEFTGFTTFDFGDASTPAGSPLGPLYYLVTSIDPVNNWLLGIALDQNSLPLIDTAITHTYAATGDFLAFTDSSARISSSATPNDHMNNPNGGYRIETLVNVGTQGANSSPVTTLPVIVPCPINGLCSFQIPAVDPNGDPLNFRLSTAAEASSFNPTPNSLGTQCLSTFCQPGPPFSTNAASVSNTGLYTWDTTGAELSPTSGFNTLYSSQVTIEDLNHTPAVKSKVAVDWLIQLVQSIGNAPVFDHPPTPACGTTFTINVGQLLTFKIQASDPDMGDVVTLNVVGLPPGATMTPPLPASGNPVSSSFSFTPTTPGAFVVTFTATDQTLQFATCSFVINVLAGPPPPPPVLNGRMTGGGGLTLADGTRVRHGFALECDLLKDPHNLQVTWGTPGSPAQKFHLETQTRALCTLDPSISAGNPAAGFNTYEGDGVGRFNGMPGATAHWKFTDQGEPGRNDTMEITIQNGMTTVLVVPPGSKLTSGNHQAH